ncbi:MAG: hypothetical protein ACLQED_06480 [Desulfobaccales bacterium]
MTEFRCRDVVPLIEDAAAVGGTDVFIGVIKVTGHRVRAAGYGYAGVHGKCLSCSAAGPGARSTASRKTAPGSHRKRGVLGVSFSIITILLE